MNGKKAKAIRRAVKEQYKDMSPATKKNLTQEQVEKLGKKLYKMGERGWVELTRKRRAK